MRNWLFPLLALSFLPLPFPGNLQAQAPWYPSRPAWQSQALGKYGTGLAVRDLNRDGWPDLVVSNGNDMRRQRVEVYYNRQGTFPTRPDWESADIDYHGHLAVGDVNGDGWPDVAVSVFLGPNRFNSPGHVKLYLNDGKGNLLKTPSWRSQDSFFTFGLALGDADGDGDLDLLVAVGEGYKNPPDYNRLYLNRNGKLDRLPAWKSLVKDHSMGAFFADVNGDGLLDLCFAGWKYPSTVYYNRGKGVFPTLPDWRTADNSTSIMGTAGDLDGDGLPELIFADNYQLSGTGHFKFYRNSKSGPSTRATWVSSFNGYGSSVALADLDGDGRLDLAGGAWWNKVRIYRNLGGTFPTNPTWSSSTKSVLEKLVFRDTSLAALYRHTEAFTGDGKKKVFTLRKIPVETILSVKADGVALAPGTWCADPDQGWISLAKAPAKSLLVETLASYRPALAASNWDTRIGNYLFRSKVEASFDLAWVFDWYDLRAGMWPYVGIARNKLSTPLNGTLEALYLDPSGRPVKKVAKPLALPAQGTNLFWGWFPPDWTLRPGLYTVQLRIVSTGVLRHMAEYPIQIRPHLPNK